MRYIKVLLLACLIFVALVFFFQNQAILTTKLQVSLDLIFLPPIKSMTLPLYFIVVCAFFIGVLMAILLLVWDRLQLSARLMKDKWQIKSLSSRLSKAESLLNKTPRPSFFARLRRFFTEDVTPVPVNDTAKQSIEAAAKALNAAVPAETAKDAKEQKAAEAAVVQEAKQSA